MFIFLELVDILNIHNEQLALRGGAEGVIDQNVIESCAAAPQWKVNYGGDVADAAAAYLYHFATTQGFRDGNKRTAVVAAIEFLARNGYVLDCQELEMFALAMQVANKQIDQDRTAAWIRDRLKSMPEGKSEVQYDINKLFEVLQKFLGGFAPDNYCSLQTKCNTGYDPNKTDYSFNKDHSSCEIDGIKRGGDFLPGNVLDVLLRKNDRAYFVSIFFSTSENEVRFRMVRVAIPPAAVLKEAFYKMRDLQSPQDVPLENGDVPFEGDFVEAGNRVTDWLQHEIERDREPA
jgi:death-on-curing protein